VGLVPDQATDLLQLLTGFTAVATADLQRDVVLLRAALADRGLGALAPAPASPTMVFAVNRAVASALSVRTLSDLARAAAAHLPGAPAPPPLTPAEVAADSEYPLLAVPAGLGVGSSGLGVIALQQRLAALGYLHVPASGVYDEATRRAVAAVQTDQGLIGDGEDDPATARALAVAHASDHPSVAVLPGDDDTVRVPASTPGGGRAGTLYLAFADGPSPVTAQVLDLLQQRGAKATFFVGQDPVAAAPETLRRIDAAGDAVGVTAEPHNAASPLAADSLFRTVSADQESVAAVLGRTPACLLAPYGASDGTTRARAVTAGLRPVVADIDPQDWRHPGSGVITTDVVANARPGSIILLHDGGGDRSQTITALRDILTSLTGLGYGFSAIPGC
jgi:peptidoglycan/xylan/chitin deacetylase (PgdA/CDA1 family)